MRRWTERLRHAERLLQSGEGEAVALLEHGERHHDAQTRLRVDHRVELLGHRRVVRPGPVTHRLWPPAPLVA